MDAFRARARSILESLTEEARPYPDLASQLEHVLGELDVDRDVRQTDPRLAG
jgi:hypothetical protein